MSSILTDAAAFALPAGVSVAAAAAAFASFALRKVAVVAPATHAASLVTGDVRWPADNSIAMTRTTGTSYDPLSRGSTG